MLLVGLAGLVGCAGAPARGASEDLAQTSFTLRTAEGEREITVHWGPAAVGTGRRGFLTARDGDRDVVSPIYALWRVERGALGEPGVELIVLGVWSGRGAGEAGARRVLRVLALERDARGHVAFVERWRGSALARPLVDFRVENGLEATAPAVLVTQELGEDGAACVRARYRWNGFGFRGEGRDEISCDAGL